MKKISKKVQTKPFTFQDWWDKEGHVYGLDAFKPCRAAWQAASKGHKL